MSADEYTAIFQRDYEVVQREFKELTLMFHDVCWYNFETECFKWNKPWRTSIPESTITLLGRRTHGGSVVIHDCSTYYQGPIRDAPGIPPQILLHELKRVYEEMQRAEANLKPHEWEPGGIEYMKLCATTKVGKFSSCLSDER